MFEQLLQLVQGNAQESVINNPAVPNEQNDAVVGEATNSITSTLQGMLGGGGNGAAQVLNLFHPENAGTDVSGHPVTQAVSGNLISSLMSKFGINGEQASGIASSLIPMVLSKLTGTANSNAGSGGLNIQSIFSSLSGGTTSGLNIGSLISQFGGNALDKNNDGKVDLSDLTAAFTGGGQNGQEPKQGAGGIMDTLTGLFK